ncbi:MAG: anaerobic ribonucleoside-triphosphate reductase activating protein [Lentisphaerae bacterium]|nr:anaerobic ribonucleoside-triphosphate reductase activating protein [Lentisphaerota bacterium]
MTASPESPVYAFLRKPSMVDFPGRLAGVFFVSGCNFRCGFCHNPDLLGRHERHLAWDRLEDVCRAFGADWVDGAVITGGEPTLAPDLKPLIGFFRRRGWAVKLDTNGSRPDVLRACLPWLDYVAMDIKTGPDGYETLTGCADISAIRESIELIKAHARDYEFRTTVIETYHDEACMRQIGELIRGSRRYVIQPFVPQDHLPDPAFRALPRTSPDRLQALAACVQPLVGEVVAKG